MPPPPSRALSAISAMHAVDRNLEERVGTSSSPPAPRRPSSRSSDRSVSVSQGKYSCMALCGHSSRPFFPTRIMPHFRGRRLTGAARKPGGHKIQNATSPAFPRHAKTLPPPPPGRTFRQMNGPQGKQARSPHASAPARMSSSVRNSVQVGISSSLPSIPITVQGGVHLHAGRPQGHAGGVHLHVRGRHRRAVGRLLSAAGLLELVGGGGGFLGPGGFPSAASAATSFLLGMASIIDMKSSTENCRLCHSTACMSTRFGPANRRTCVFRSPNFYRSAHLYGTRDCPILRVLSKLVSPSHPPPPLQRGVGLTDLQVCFFVLVHPLALVVVHWRLPGPILHQKWRSVGVQANLSVAAMSDDSIDPLHDSRPGLPKHNRKGVLA